MAADGGESNEVGFSQRDRVDLHWLALRLYQGLGSIEHDVVRRHGITLWGYEVLVAVAESAQRSQLALAHSLGLDKSKMVLVLDELQAAGFVTRIPDPTDRRVRIIEATVAGLAARAAVATDLQKTEDLLLAKLSNKDRKSLLGILHEVVNGPLSDLQVQPEIMRLTVPGRPH
jgi:DNA-binding MarR family transcriptional regulator